MKIRILTILFLFTFVIISCSDMDDKYKEYIVPNGITYPGKVTKLRIFPGHDRLRFSWLKGTDPRVVEARIFWNNYRDSVKIDIPDKDTISYLLENMPENTYSLFVRTYDVNKNASVPVEILGITYGENYQASLLSRAIEATEIDETGKLNVLWGVADITNGATATEIRYVNTQGKTKIIQSDIKSNSTEISDFSGYSYEYRTLFLPDSLAIDTFYTNFIKQKNAMKISKKNWIATADSWEPTGQMPKGGLPSFVIDDNPDTYWHTNHTQQTSNFPHWLAFDMKKKVAVERVELTSRYDYFGADFKNFRIEGRNSDSEEWVSYGTFNLADKTGPQSFILEGTPKMRYLRIFMLEGQFPPHCHLAEFSAYGSFVD